MTDSNDSRILETLFETILSRKGDSPETSYTAKLFSRGRVKIVNKMGEEAFEVASAALAEEKENVISESADLLYHLSVLWADTGVTPTDVFNALTKRVGTSGIVEKSSRSRLKADPHKQGEKE